MVDISVEPIYGDPGEHIRPLLDSPRAVAASFLDGKGGSTEPQRNERPLGTVLSEHLDDLEPNSARAKLWRDHGYDPDRIRIVHRPDGSSEWHLRGVKDLPYFEHHDIWSATDASTMHDLMIRFLDDERGSFMYNISKWSGNADPSEFALWSDGSSTTDNAKCLSRQWSKQDFFVSLADDSFVKTLQGMTDAAPHEPLHADELIAPEGLLFLRQPTETSKLLIADDDSTEAQSPIRALSWWTDNARLFVHFFSDAGERRWTDARVVDHITPYLLLHIHTEIDFDAKPSTMDEETLRTAGLMRSLYHLASSPIAQVERVQYQRSNKKSRNRSDKKKVDITRLSLRPTATPPATRTGNSAPSEDGPSRHARRHLAQGHWRNQWYPSRQDHRLIWIDEHWRGNTEIGVVDGKKIYIARGD